MKNIFKNKSVIFTVIAVIIIIAVICSFFFLKKKDDVIPDSDVKFATDESGTGVTDSQGNTYSTDPSGYIISQDGMVYETDEKGNGWLIIDAEPGTSDKATDDSWAEGEFIPYPTIEDEPSESETERPEPTENNDSTLPTNETGGIELPPVPFGKR